MQSLAVGGLQHHSLGHTQGTRMGTTKHSHLKSSIKGLFLNEKIIKKTLGFLLENYFAKQKSIIFSFTENFKTLETMKSFYFPRFTL